MRTIPTVGDIVKLEESNEIGIVEDYSEGEYSIFGIGAWYISEELIILEEASDESLKVLENLDNDDNEGNYYDKSRLEIIEMLDDPDDFNEEHFQNAQKIYKYLKGKELQYNK